MTKKNILSQAVDEIKEHVDWENSKEEIKEEVVEGQYFHKFIGWTIVIVIFIHVCVI